MKTDSIKVPLAKYQDRWVAMTPRQDKVIASGKDLGRVIVQARKVHKEPVFMKVYSSSHTISPSCYAV